MNTDDLIHDHVRTLAAAQQHLRDAAREGSADGIDTAQHLRADVLTALEHAHTYERSRNALVRHLAATLRRVGAHTASHAGACVQCDDLKSRIFDCHVARYAWTGTDR